MQFSFRYGFKNLISFELWAFSGDFLGYFSYFYKSILSYRTFQKQEILHPLSLLRKFPLNFSNYSSILFEIYQFWEHSYIVFQD